MIVKKVMVGLKSCTFVVVVLILFAMRWRRLFLFSSWRDESVVGIVAGGLVEAEGTVPALDWSAVYDEVVVAVSLGYWGGVYFFLLPPLPMVVGE